MIVPAEPPQLTPKAKKPVTRYVVFAQTLLGEASL
jgi:hypothetical protein